MLQVWTVIGRLVHRFNLTYVLQALGQRILHSSEADNRRRKKEQLEALIAEKQAELERLRAEHESLESIEGEQIKTIERMMNNEV